MEGLTIFVCEDSLEGVFTGIYDAWASERGHENCRLQAGDEENYRLFSEYIYVKTDPEKAAKVDRTICSRLGESASVDLCRALASTDPDKAEAVYKTVVDGLTAGSGRAVMQKLQNPYVHKVFELSRNVANEAHFMLEFLRFSELYNGVLFSRIGPSNNVLPIITPHFADRLPLENFMILDEHRNMAAIHPKSSQWFLTSGEGLDLEKTCRLSGEEEKIQELFKYFCRCIAVEPRRNLNLQRQMLPLHYRKYMTEFQ